MVQGEPSGGDIVEEATVWLDLAFACRFGAVNSRILSRFA